MTNEEILEKWKTERILVCRAEHEQPGAWDEEHLALISLARAATLEEAMRTVKELAFKYGPETETPYLYGEQKGIGKAANAIRTLKEKPE